MNLRKYLFLGCLLFLSSICLMSPSTGIANSVDRLQIDYSDKRLSAIIENSSLIAVLEKMQAKTGLIFAVAEDVGHRKVTARFNPLPLERALKIILDGFNYSLIYDPSDNVQKVTILNDTQNIVTQHARLTPENDGVDIGFPPNVESESRQSVYGIEQIEKSDTGTLVSSSNSRMIFEPSKSGSMEIVTSSEPMQIDLPNSDDTMIIDFSFQSTD